MALLSVIIPSGRVELLGGRPSLFSCLRKHLFTLPTFSTYSVRTRSHLNQGLVSVQVTHKCTPKSEDEKA